MKLLLRILYSRAAGFLLVTILVFALVSLGMTMWPSIVMRFSRIEPLVAPKIDSVERAAREHMQSARQRCDLVMKDLGATPRQKGLAYGELGKVYYAYDFVDAAVPCFRNASKLDPSEFRWPYLLAHSLDRAGKTNEAPAPMALAVSRMDKDVTSNTVDYLAALCFLGQAAVRLNKPAEARRTFAEVLRIAPHNLFSLLKMGQLASQSGDSSAAIRYFETALQQAPNRPEIRQLLGAEYRRRGDTAKAAEFPADGAGGRKPQPVVYPDPVIHQVNSLNMTAALQNRIGFQQERLGHNKEALAHFKRAVEADPESVVSRLNLGAALLTAGQATEAQYHLEEARRMDPASENVRAGLFVAYASSPATRRKGLEEALAWRKEHPGQIEPLRTLADVYLRMDRQSDAWNAYQEAARLAPAEIWPRMGAARALAALGRYPAARAEYEDLIRTSPNESEVRVLLARLLAGCPDAKVRDGARAVEMAQKLVAAQYNLLRAETLAVALGETGQFPKAIEIQRKVVENIGEQADANVRARGEAVLQSLEAQKPWRESVPFQGVKK